MIGLELPSRVIKFLSEALSEPEFNREELEFIHAFEGVVISTDGYRLHAVELEVEPGVYVINRKRIFRVGNLFERSEKVLDVYQKWVKYDGYQSYVVNPFPRYLNDDYFRDKWIPATFVIDDRSFVRFAGLEVSGREKIAFRVNVRYFCRPYELMGSAALFYKAPDEAIILESVNYRAVIMPGNPNATY